MKRKESFKFALFKKCSIVIFITLFISIYNMIIYSPVAITRNNEDDLVFIHHSCGQNWLTNSLHEALLAKDYIDERNDIYYNTDISPDTGRPDSLAPEPGDFTNMNHWILWFNDYIEGVKNHGCDNGFNQIIMFKSCYPISNIVSNGSEPGDPFSSTQTIVNYKAVYRHPDGPGNYYIHNEYIYWPLEDIFADNPDILFISVTAPPLCYSCTNDENAHRARVFNNWLKSQWLNDYNDDNSGLNNVAVYDWFNFLANPDDHPTYPNRLKEEYGGSTSDSHPNVLANQESTEDFATNQNNFIDTKWNEFNNDSIIILNPYPPDEAIDISIDISELNITINDPEGDSFNWTIETSPDIGSSFGIDDGNGTKSCSVSNVDFNTTYTWFINATDNGSGSTGYRIYTFTTENNNPPNPPSDPYPNDGAIDVDINADLSWYCSDPDGDDLTYDVYFEAGDTSPDEIVSNNQSENTYDPGEMEYDTHYYWKIVAWDDGGMSSEGPIWDFITTSIPNNPPYQPSEPNPENGSTNISVDQYLSWVGGDPDIDDTVVYDVFLEANDPTPDNKVADDILETEYSPETLDFETIYYWRIIAKDNHGASVWGPVWHFTTEPNPKPFLSCEGTLFWDDIKPGETVDGYFIIENVGEQGSVLDWQIHERPSWGTWFFEPESGINLTPEDGEISVKVVCQAPADRMTKFNGEITIINQENLSNSCTINIELKTPFYKPFRFMTLIYQWIFNHFPNVLPILRYIF